MTEGRVMPAFQAQAWFKPFHWAEPSTWQSNSLVFYCLVVLVLILLVSVVALVVLTRIRRALGSIERHLGADGSGTDDEQPSAR